MKLLNFSFVNFPGQYGSTQYLKVADKEFDLHNGFRLQGYHYDTLQRVFTLNLHGIAYWGTEDTIKTDFKIVFENVRFLKLVDFGADDTVKQFSSMEFADKAYREDDFDDLLNHVFSPGNIIKIPDPKAVDWKDYMLIYFIAGLEILISAETVKVLFHQLNHPDD